ncbi:MgtC/SapB family protein [Bosea caraganae]|uniref:Protein MgtC n=1 Tax=Bosea caraganae TaxID=2763117 RepID=A0A370LDB1_9HYPH|nr:MgtC/SapB family protein [Bosea caraganae]RDJ27906.1 MgtC/SapB family protein [Bosea caraganae]RDJ29921.1 MgtC/SapB family protein [Bosea caraganae]
MQFIATFDLPNFLDTLVSLFVAFVLGTAIGAERQYRQRSAGLRTNVLVAVGAAVFVDLAMRLEGSGGAVRVIANVVTGIGFLGAGVIMKEGLNVRGLNTAATLWASAAVGACAGTDRIAEAILATLLILACNTLLRPLVNRINRIPIDEGSSEAIYQVRVVAGNDHVEDIRKALFAELKRAKYPVADIDLDTSDEDATEIVATLVSSSADTDELNSAIANLRTLKGVTHAGWEVSTSD